jgi:hypothetical protein
MRECKGAGKISNIVHVRMQILMRMPFMVCMRECKCVEGYIKEHRPLVYVCMRECKGNTGGQDDACVHANTDANVIHGVHARMQMCQG